MWALQQHKHIIFVFISILCLLLYFWEHKFIITDLIPVCLKWIFLLYQHRKFQSTNNHKIIIWSYQHVGNNLGIGKYWTYWTISKFMLSFEITHLGKFVIALCKCGSEPDRIDMTRLQFLKCLKKYDWNQRTYINVKRLTSLHLLRKKKSGWATQTSNL